MKPQKSRVSESSVRSLKRAKKAARQSHGISAAFRAASPNSSTKLVGRIVANLLNTQGHGEELEHQLKEIGAMKFPRDRAALRSLLIELEEVLLYHGRISIEELRRDVPRLLRDLDRKSFRSRERAIRRRSART
jgi:hypothetical protein